ncbi:MAG: hypothetical protein WDZ83_12085 [Rhizobiaceae bacterium]
MKIFRLEPAAAPGDPNWDIAPSQGTVIVRAASPADARLVASEAEADFLNSGSLPADDKSTRFASAFRNDKLYSVTEIADSKYPADGERAVLEGDIDRDVLTKSAG